MSNEKTGVIEFLELARYHPVIDVRAPSEFTSGHIPGALNIPLFSDRERELVGTRYKKEGYINALLEGLKHSGPSFSEKLFEALKIAGNNGKLLVHCWRGGMRSEAMAWLFRLGKIDVHVLEGGYKSYRHHVLETLSAKRKTLILGGLTGSGKTDIIKNILLKGHQAIDLEGIAHHKGSAFGSLGQLPQPTTEHFANLLFKEWINFSDENPLWLEDESKSIGMVFLPDILYINMQEAPTVVLMMDVKTRLPRLMQEYSLYLPEELIASVMKIGKRLGGDNTKEAIAAVERGDIQKAIEITLDYYDKAYLFGLQKKGKERACIVNTDTDDVKINTERVLAASLSVKWQ